MKFNFINQVSQPLFGLERRDSNAKLLSFLLTAAIVANGLYIVGRMLIGETFLGPSIITNFALLLIHILSLVAVGRGYVKATAIFTVYTAWAGMTYQAWIADGVRDTAVIVYILIIMISALITSWRISLVVSILSIFAIWGMAIGEVAGVRFPMIDSPYSTAWELTAIFLMLIALVYLVISTIRQTLTAVREGDERFRKVFQISPVAINVTTLTDGKLLEANDAYWKLTGFDPATALGKTTVELTIWDGEADRQVFVKELIATRSLRNPGYEFLNDKGERRITVAFYELLDTGGEPSVLSMFYDVTEQIVAKEALEQSEARIRALLEAVPDMIFELDRDSKILQFIPSSTIEPLLPPEEFVGKSISQFMPPDVYEQTMFAVERALESGLLQVFEYQLPEENKQNYYEASVIRNDVNSVLAMVRDVTARKWAATERENLIDELEKKNAELEQFTYTVSHDLKSPLITIRGFLGYIREDIEKGNKERLETDMQRISDATEKMQKLLGDLLELSRVGRLVNDPEDADMNALVAETVELLHGRLTQNNIQMQVSDNLPILHVDRQRIVEVLQNLIDNAAKFMGDQAGPIITVGQEGVLNGMPVIFVKDNGVGISPEFKDQVFGLFNKLDARSDGTGIGLALVKRIIEFHGGRIWLESELGSGTTFFFTLPAHPTPER